MTPHPEPRIMTTADDMPKLESIAGGARNISTVLARELLALRDRIERCDEWSVQHGQMIDGQDKRLTALERVQRDAVPMELTEVDWQVAENAWRQECEEAKRERDEMHRELMRQPTDPPTSREIRDALRLAGAYRKRAEKAEAERDHLKKSIRCSDRDHWFARCDELEGDLDEARAALRTILAITSMAARQPHGDAYNAAAAVLASATPAEGGEG